MVKASILRAQPGSRINPNMLAEKLVEAPIFGMANEFFEGMPLSITACELKMWNGSAWISVT